MGAQWRGQAGRHGLQAQVASDAVLEMDDVIALLQFGKIDVQQRPARSRVRRFQPARALHFVTPKNLRVRDHDQFGRFKKKTARERAQPDVQSAWISQAVFPPNFLETLPFAIVVAEKAHFITLARPAMQLLEKLFALR